MIRPLSIAALAGVALLAGCTSSANLRTGEAYRIDTVAGPIIDGLQFGFGPCAFSPQGTSIPPAPAAEKDERPEQGALIAALTPLLGTAVEFAVDKAFDFTLEALQKAGEPDPVTYSSTRTLSARTEVLNECLHLVAGEMAPNSDGFTPGRLAAHIGPRAVAALSIQGEGGLARLHGAYRDSGLFLTAPPRILMEIGFVGHGAAALSGEAKAVGGVMVSAETRYLAYRRVLGTSRVGERSGTRDLVVRINIGVPGAVPKAAATTDGMNAATTGETLTLTFNDLETKWEARFEGGARRSEAPIAVLHGTAGTGRVVKLEVVETADANAFLKTLAELAARLDEETGEDGKKIARTALANELVLRIEGPKEEDAVTVSPTTVIATPTEEVVAASPLIPMAPLLLTARAALAACAGDPSGQADARATMRAANEEAARLGTTAPFSDAAIETACTGASG